ncbi:MAG: ABC transporter ATP-binding protein [Thermodesulfobacteriota bacterium]|jgi:lipooligosaccharide transport system ATP-binding protein|nr:ABC transporter ATP-binding protein [Thermodesulfobacteriota bacterium]
MAIDLVKESVVVLHQVTKTFGRTCAVDGISLAVGRGTCFGLTGDNGAGKSTTLKMIYGFLRPSSGRITVEALDVGKRPRDVRKLLGIVPQDDLLDGDLNVGDNLLFHGRYAGLSSREACGRTRRVLQQMGLEARASDPVTNLSGGMRRRLVLARALLTRPRILLLDEPSRGLDHASRESYLAMLLRLKREGMTLLLASHDQAEIELLCDQVAQLENGRVKDVGSVTAMQPGRDRKVVSALALRRL